MPVINEASQIGSGISPMKVAAYTVSHAEPLEKVAKIIERTISIAEIVMGTISVAFSNLGKQLKDTIIVFETLRFIGAVKTLITPDAKTGEYFLRSAKNSWQKCVDRVALLFHTCFKMIKGLNRFGFVDLGFMAKDAIGKLPIFTLVMDSFMIVSASFGTWDNVLKSLPRARSTQKLANEKLEKWEYRLTDIDMLKVNDKSTCKHFESRYANKANSLHAELDQLEKNNRLNEDTLQEVLDMKAKGETKLSVESQEKIIAECQKVNTDNAAKKAIIEAKLGKVERRVSMIAENNFKELAEELEKKDIKFKERKWETVKANGGRDELKTWSRIANSVGKIAVILFAFTLTALNVWTTPFLLSLLAMGILVDSIGLTKILLEKFYDPLEMPTPAPVVANA